MENQYSFFARMALGGVNSDKLSVRSRAGRVAGMPLSGSHKYLKYRKAVRTMASLLLVAALTGCAGRDAVEPEPDGGRPVVLSVAVAPLQQGSTRTAAGSDVQGGAFLAGETFFAYFSEGSSVSNTRYTIQSAVTTTAPDTQPYFLNSASQTVVHGYYPYASDKKVTNATTSFSVELDQSSDAGYKKSDLMYGTATILKSSGTGQLTFAHQMAKLIVTATAAAPITRITDIRIVGGKRTVALTPVTSGSTLALGVVSDELTDQPGGYVTMYKGGTAATAGTCVALLPPQTLNGNLLEVVTDRGNVYYSVPANTAIASGRSYTVALAPTLAQIGTTTQVQMWALEDATSVAGQVSESQVFTVGNATFQMNFVKGGDFTTLRGQSVTGRVSDFYMGQTEVTVGLWRAVEGRNVVNANAQMKDVGDEYPMSNISHTDMVNFVNDLNARLATERPAGWRFAIPTEVQWEYAARGGQLSDPATRNSRTVPGNYALAEAAWYNGNSGPSGGTWTAAAGFGAHPVGTKKPNELGLYDMIGNVYDHIRDCGALPADKNLGVDYVGPSASSNCGGTFKHNASSANAQTAINSRYDTEVVMSDAGLRLAMVPVPGAKSFSFTGGVQEYVVTKAGKYMLEVWGAQGGNGNGIYEYNESSATEKQRSNAISVGGKGGYCKTVVNITAVPCTLYVYVGGKGGNGGWGYSVGTPGASAPMNAPGGWNGGGAGGMGYAQNYEINGSTVTLTTHGNPGGGGGATFIAKSQIGPIDATHNVQTNGTAHADLLVIAGGGGGYGWISGGDGGGVNGGANTTGISAGATQPYGAWGRNSANANWANETDFLNDYNSMGQQGANAIKASGCMEGCGGGGGGFRGGDARIYIGELTATVSASIGGCGGSSWGVGTLVTAAAWASTAGEWMTESGVRVGNGAATITPVD